MAMTNKDIANNKKPNQSQRNSTAGCINNRTVVIYLRCCFNLHLTKNNSTNDIMVLTQP